METILFLTSLIFLAFTGYFHNRVEGIFNKTTKGILFTASTIYAFMTLLYSNNPDTVIRLWRYIDWFITVPLLMGQLYLFIDVKVRKQKHLISIIGMSIFMLTMGLFGELGYISKLTTNLLGTLSMSGIFYVLFTKIPKKHFKFLLTVSVLWLFYPIVYLIQDSVSTIIAFSIVDLCAKVGTSFYIESKEKSFT